MNSGNGMRNADNFSSSAPMSMLKDRLGGNKDMFTRDLKSAYQRGKWVLVMRGLIGIAVGIFVLARPVESVAVFALVIAFWAVFDGIAHIVSSFDLRSEVPHWWVMLVSGIVSLAFGVAALRLYPVLSLTFAVLWSAWWLMATGALAA